MIENWKHKAINTWIVDEDGKQHEINAIPEIKEMTFLPGDDLSARNTKIPEIEPMEFTCEVHIPKKWQIIIGRKRTRHGPMRRRSWKRAIEMVYFKK